MWNPSTCDYECNKTFKVDYYLHKKKRLCKKLLFGKLVLAFENRILNSTVISLDDKKVICKENNDLNDTILLVTICLFLLLVTSTSCYYYFTRHCLEENIYYHITTPAVN